MDRMSDGMLRQGVAGLSGRGLALALLAKYAALTIYGIWAAIVEIPTFVMIGSSIFAVAWAALVALFASLAAVGIGITWRTGRFRFEYIATAAFILTFVGYSFALIWRSIDTANWQAAPLAIIPLAVCILPGIHFYSLSLRVRPKRGVSKS